MMFSEFLLSELSLIFFTNIAKYIVINKYFFEKRKKKRKKIMYHSFV